MPTIGPYQLHAIDAGWLRLDGGAMFGIVPKPLWEKRIRPDEKNRIPLRMRCLLLEGEGRVILVDTGIGNKLDEKTRRIFAVDQETANLHESLGRAGFQAGDVTDVILTHLHFDHCGGCTSLGRSLEVTFPHARHYVQRAHWASVLCPNAREAASFRREDFEILEASGQLCLLDEDDPLFPNVETIRVDGHTEGQQLVKISNGDRTLVFMADLLPTTAHLRNVWIMAYDVRPLVSMEEKRRFLEEAVDGGWDLFFEHDPDTVVGTPVRTSRGIEIAEQRSLDDL